MSPPEKDNARRAAGASQADRHDTDTTALLALPLGELLRRLCESQGGGDTDPWLDVEPALRRRVVAAAERGEVMVSRIGRRVLWRRSERDAFIERHRVQPRAAEPERPQPPSRIAHLVGGRHG